MSKLKRKEGRKVYDKNAKIMGERDGQGRRNGTLCDERDNKKGTWIISREDR